MRLRSPALALAALALAGCGRENPALIPQDRAERLSNTVDEIGQLVADGDCAAARDAVDRAQEAVSELPRRVDDRLETNLRQWLDHIDERIPEDCSEQPEETPTPTPSPEETETPTPTPTPEETETPTPTPTPAPTETPAPVEPDGGTGVPGGDEG
jgi:outer membrane biosynthesis protein TonB